MLCRQATALFAPCVLLISCWASRVPAQGHDSHQLKKPDTSFISALHASHPGARVAVLTDQATQIELPPEVRLFRYALDRAKLGRNAYANYYQYLAQVRGRCLAGTTLLFNPCNPLTYRVPCEFRHLRAMPWVLAPGGAIPCCVPACLQRVSLHL